MESLIVEQGNIWDMECDIRCITTNGITNASGQAIMGRGVALQAANLYPELKTHLGSSLRSGGNKVYYWPEYDIVTFPTKHHWKQDADLRLIEKSAWELMILVINNSWKRVLLPAPGTLNGKLSWSNEVKPMLEKLQLPDSIVVIWNE